MSDAGADGAAGSSLLASVQVLPGPGIVARFGDVLLWMEEAERGGHTTVARLLDLARRLADETPGPDIGGRVAEALRADPEAVPAMVLVAPTSSGLRAVVHGWGRVLADGVDIDGGWADRELEWTTALAAGRRGDLLRVPTPGSVLDLRRGSTPGGGAAVALAPREAVPTPEPAPAAGPSPWEAAPVAPQNPQAQDPAPAPEAPPFELIDLRAGTTAREPLPVGGTNGAGGATVKGVVCSRGHFNNPVALACRTCGSSMADITRILQDGVRPPLGALVVDDGTTFGLDTDHLIGSAPEDDPAVAAGGARPVTIVDPQVAPVHAEVRLVGWDVVLVARAPTFVLVPSTQQWTPAPPGQPSPLATGARVAVGQRTVVFESRTVAE